MIGSELNKLSWNERRELFDSVYDCMKEIINIEEAVANWRERLEHSVNIAHKLYHGGCHDHAFIGGDGADAFKELHEKLAAVRTVLETTTIRRPKYD